MSLPLRLPSDQMQQLWKSQLDPLLANQLTQGQLLTGISLHMGENDINTLLSRKQVGWIIVDQTAAASIFRSRPFNSVTLTLNSSAPCTVNLWVF